MGRFNRSDTPASKLMLNNAYIVLFVCCLILWRSRPETSELRGSAAPAENGYCKLLLSECCVAATHWRVDRVISATLNSSRSSKRFVISSKQSYFIIKHP
ncbi:hypothetical protein SFRURICE_006123 [Spodoptera frugiperda]|uniref:SFRICE_032043 n=1 Tax=Spodoptera frugiperda TaxID=7108 RepID=A0A2H1WQK8_SPOFR|nr:hypothetical protein SFRURICE_006123 [Spodoptera frugiperda]